MTIYALWNACFNEDQRVLVVANKEGTAIEIFQRIRLAYEELPNWLKPGVKEYGKASMTLANGSRIGIVRPYSNLIPSGHGCLPKSEPMDSADGIHTSSMKSPSLSCI